MRSSTHFITLALAMVYASLTLTTTASAAAAPPSVTHQRREQALSPREIEDLVIRRAKYPTCSPAGQPSENGILLPRKGAKLKVNQPFEVYYCSPTYHETFSVSYDILAMNKDSPNSGLLLASGVQQQISNVTIPDAWYNTVAVFERQAGYGGDQFALTKRSVTIRDDDQ